MINLLLKYRISFCVVLLLSSLNVAHGGVTEIVNYTYPVSHDRANTLVGVFVLKKLDGDNYLMILSSLSNDVKLEVRLKKKPLTGLLRELENLKKDNKGIPIPGQIGGSGPPMSRLICDNRLYLDSRSPDFKGFPKKFHEEVVNLAKLYLKIPFIEDLTRGKFSFE